MYGGGGIAAEYAMPTVRRCTLSGNLGDQGGGIWCDANSPLLIENSIITFSVDGGALRCDASAVPTLTCCDIYGNVGGDWTGLIAEQLGQNGNICLDPWFCDAANGNYHLAEVSPCIGGTCGQIGAWGIGCGGPEPWISGVADIGEDQGGQVRVTWIRSPYDGGRDLVITSYAVYRRQDGRLHAPEETIRLVSPAAEGERARLAGWDCVGTVPARGDSTYQLVSPTLCDSTAEGGICWSVFLVSAVTPDPLVYFDSAPDSGYSVDNLAPGVPDGLRFEGATLLVWEESDAADFDYFTVYGSPLDHLDETAEMIAYTIATSMDIAESPHDYYHLTATDFAGNEGEEASIAGASAAPESDPPAAWGLRHVRPNPLTARTVVQYDVPQAQQVTLHIHDVAGRQICVLAAGVQLPGRHMVEWRGQSSSGKRVESGIYFLQMMAEGFSARERLVVLE